MKAFRLALASVLLFAATASPAGSPTAVLAPVVANYAAPKVSDPKAVLTGPTVVKVGERFLLDATGSQSNQRLVIQVAKGPDTATILPLFLETAPDVYALTYGAVTLSKVGTYEFVAVAVGAFDAGQKPPIAVGFWTVVVEPLSPSPTPPPPPPVPPPTPPPTPTPGYSGPLWAILILPDPPTIDQSAMRVSTPIRAAMASDGKAYYLSYLVDETEVTANRWKPIVDQNGGPPIALWLKPDGVLGVTKAPTEAAIMADLKKIRGTP